LLVTTQISGEAYDAPIKPRNATAITIDTIIANFIEFAIIQFYNRVLKLGMRGCSNRILRGNLVMRGIW